MAAQVSDFDRFSFTLFVALALHAVLVLGITIAPESPPRSAQTMEITLAQFDDEVDPEEADFLAQTSQQGSGTEEERQELATAHTAVFNDPAPQPVQPLAPAQTAVSAPSPAVVTTVAPARPAVAAEDERSVAEDLPVRNKQSLMERSLEIASLEARLDAQLQSYAKKPRVLRVTAASTLRSANAWYVQNWVSKVTRVGNMNYPAEARRAGVYGALRMLVSLRNDGSIKEIAILESSGSSVLDDAAIHIVRMASPFAPFPANMKEQTDELEIIRTWSFQRQGLSSG
ncbi:energy transducer TonB [Marinobacter sp. X15-166B]|uniref:energy transducer TonB n=1 Tax=Marinobacter sp. X15-166B TaxID=1897620 RepID=UPI00085C1580|nr:TonB family protein [Marinobacter sp. X15-166B]OEY65854.1 energy transducer TonB [Marinobacter sp. X15-166B]